MKNDAKFERVISSEHKLFDLHIGETLHYKDLIFLLVKRDFVALYKQTILGPIWAIVQPLLTTVVFTVIFGNLAGLTTADTEGDFVIPGFLFYMIGNICWSYFSSTLSVTSNTFINNRNTMGKVYYPRIISPLSSALSNLISFGIQFALMFIILVVYLIKGNTSICITPQILLIVPCILEMMILSVGCGIIISALTTKYRDLAMLVGFGLQLWQYGSPVAYGLQLIPQKYQFLYMLNPVSSIVTTFRYALFGFGYFNIFYYLLSIVLSIVIFIVGLIMFSRIERNFMDTV